MNPQSAFARKIIYGIAILVLLVPLHLLGQPSAAGPEGSAGETGGLLAQFRANHKLSESQLGEVDPASSTIRLTTLGLRGVAANLLWEKSNTYKMKKDWTNLAATLNQIAKLEPHYVNVWRFQAWNLSYNVSAEFDDYRERYRWVLKGIDFLEEGIHHNHNEPHLVWDVGWYTSNKISRADESKQFRRMFRVDEDFLHKQEADPLFNIPRVPDNDNWLVGKEWYRIAENMVERGADLKKTTPVLFWSHRPMCQMNYGDNLETDGSFGEVVQRAFEVALQEWTGDFGQRAIPASGPGEPVVLNDVEPLREHATQLLKQLYAMAPGGAGGDCPRAQEVPYQRSADSLGNPACQTDGEAGGTARTAQVAITVTDEQVARKVPGDRRAEALSLAADAKKDQDKADNIARYRGIVNFEYWRMHAKAEQTAVSRNARKNIYDAEHALADNDLVRARERDKKGWALWRKVLDANPAMATDGSYEREIGDAVKKYRKFLKQDDQPFPKDFELNDILKNWHQDYGQSGGQ